jgi:hypothetical protein
LQPLVLGLFLLVPVATLGPMREFDLSIERVLENWTVAHALREIIANALDEHALTGSAEPTIWRSSSNGAKSHGSLRPRGSVTAPRRFRPGPAS